jgi:phenylacetate-CoA ligase
MKLLEIIRSKAFWFLDFIKGNPIGKQLKEITLINENYHSKKAIQYREKYLKDLLKHATATVPFYKKYSYTTNLLDFPVMNKIMVREDYKAFTTTDSNLKSNYIAATSGSSGIPFKVSQDKKKRYRNIADTIYYARKAGSKIGMKVFFLRVWKKVNIKNPIIAWMQNVKMQEVANFNDEEITKFINLLSKNKLKKGVWAYASSLDTIAKYFETLNKEIPQCNLSSIVACSEYLNKKTKTVLEAHFKAPVISRYSNAENGVMAQQKTYGNDNFDINWASYYFEVLKLNQDIPADEGELGRIVITDLFNFCMPIIRYDIGDVASIKYDKDNIPVFSAIEGRRLDLIYNTKGELISSLTITANLTKYFNIKQYQFIQNGKTNYAIKLNVTNKFNEEKQLLTEGKKLLGENSEIELIYIDEIPLLSSGKRKIVVNNYT